MKYTNVIRRGLIVEKMLKLRTICIYEPANYSNGRKKIDPKKQYCFYKIYKKSIFLTNSIINPTNATKYRLLFLANKRTGKSLLHETC